MQRKYREETIEPLRFIRRFVYRILFKKNREPLRKLYLLDDCKRGAKLNSDIIPYTCEILCHFPLLLEKNIIDEEILERIFRNYLNEFDLCQVFLSEYILYIIGKHDNITDKTPRLYIDLSTFNEKFGFENVLVYFPRSNESRVLYRMHPWSMALYCSFLLEFDRKIYDNLEIIEALIKFDSLRTSLLALRYNLNINVSKEILIKELIEMGFGGLSSKLLKFIENNNEREWYKRLLKNGC